MRKMILLLLACSIIGACAKSPLDVLGPENYSLSGRVVDVVTTAPLEGITVELQIFDGFLLDVGKTKVVTDSKGEFHINYQDTRDFYLYWAQLYVELPSEEKYQLGAIVNGEEHCRSYFAVGNTGDYEVQLLQYPSYRLQVLSVPTGWEDGILDAQILVLNPTCSDTLLVESALARLNNPVEMSNFSKWRKIERSNQVMVNYTLSIDNVIHFSKQVSTECIYGGKTDINLILE